MDSLHDASQHATLSRSESQHQVIINGYAAEPAYVSSEWDIELGTSLVVFVSSSESLAGGELARHFHR